MDETRQINLCIDEMAKLKEKMEALEKQKILNEKNELLKKTTMEPNLKVLEDWLVDYHKAIEDEKEKIGYKYFDKLSFHTSYGYKTLYQYREFLQIFTAVHNMVNTLRGEIKTQFVLGFNSIA